MLAITLLAWWQPVSSAEADPGGALVAAQALARHGTLDVGVFSDDPRLAYDLDDDYRFERRADGRRLYFSIGVPILTAPAVWMANRLGWDMLDRDDETALANLLSALACGLVFLLLYRLGRLLFLPHLASLGLAAVFQLGSSLISTLATGLWNLDLAVPLMLIALNAVARLERDGKAGRAGTWWTAGVALLLATLCRPAAAFAIIAFFLYALLWRGWRRRWVLAAAVVLAAALVALDSVPIHLAGSSYYAPQRLIGRTPLDQGLVAILLSPSRGLFVFCPFLLPLLAACWRERRFLLTRRLAWLAAYWSLAQVLALATKGKWWGGYSFGPRLLTEAMLPAFLVATLLLASRWQTLRGLAVVGVALAVPAVAIHSGQGLLNPATWEWNIRPDIDVEQELLFDWRHPQWLASGAQLAARNVHWQRQSLVPLEPGRRLLPTTPAGVFDGWWPPESALRWASSEAPRICFVPQGFSPFRGYVLRLELSALGSQSLALRLGKETLGNASLGANATRLLSFPVAGKQLVHPTEVCLGFDGLQPLLAGAGDPRKLAMAFRSLRFDRLPKAMTRFDDDAAFLDGWSTAEKGWRWNDGSVAKLVFFSPADAGRKAALVIEGFGLGEQRVTVALAGVDLGSWKIGPARAIYRMPLPSQVDPVDGFLAWTLRFPDATQPGNGDQRQLAFAIIRAGIEPERFDPEAPDGPY